MEIMIETGIFNISRTWTFYSLQTLSELNTEPLLYRLCFAVTLVATSSAYTFSLFLSIYATKFILSKTNLTSLAMQTFMNLKDIMLMFILMRL